jgi:N-acyl-L-homoserine lactone synthetase
MLRETFPALLDGEAAPTSDSIWESSRFGVDLCTREAKTAGSIAPATYELFAGMIEFGLMQQLTDIVTVTDARMERILCRARAGLCDVSARRGRSEKRSRSQVTSRCLRSGFSASGKRDVSMALELAPWEHNANQPLTIGRWSGQSRSVIGSRD